MSHTKCRTLSSTTMSIQSLPLKSNCYGASQFINEITSLSPYICLYCFRDEFDESDLNLYLENTSSESTTITNLTEQQPAIFVGPEIVITGSPTREHRRLTATYSAPSTFQKSETTNNKVQN